VDHSETSSVANESQTISWEEYIKDRERRNILKMNRSYADLVSLGQSYLSQKNYEQALFVFFDAKTIFPDRLTPRKNLAYIYILMCQQDRRYCKMAKREIYYASIYMGEGDLKTKEYIEELADLLDMQEILEMPEKEALSAIF
jgi:tetratricopeptide (TPR) repeat protein